MQLVGVSVLVVCVFGLLYVMFLYPLLLDLRSRRPKPVHPASGAPTVTVLLPVRNGAPWLRGKLESILALDYPRQRMQVVVISDGSTDATDEIAAEFVPCGIEFVRIESGGKARALNAGLERATGEILFYTDVRQTIERGSLRHLVTYFADPQVGVISGELIIRDGKTGEELYTGLYWRYEKWIRKRHSQIDSVGGATGCIYAMRRKLAVRMPGNTLLDDVYLPTAAFFQGYRVLWTDGAKAYDYPTRLDVEYKRKVRTQAGMYQIILFYPQLLNPFRNRMWFHFCSHKLGRLMLPFFLLGVMAGTFALPKPWYNIVFGIQCLVYFTALIDPAIPDGLRFKRLTSLLRAFVVLVAAAFTAVSILFQPRKDFWTITRVGDSETRP